MSLIAYPGSEPLVKLPVRIVSETQFSVYDDRDKRIGIFTANIFESPVDEEAAADQFCGLINYPQQARTLLYQPVLGWGDKDDRFINLPLFTNTATRNERACVVFTDCLDREIFQTVTPGPLKLRIAKAIKERVNGTEGEHGSHQGA